MACTPRPSSLGRGVKTLEKYLLTGGKKFLFWWGGGDCTFGGGSNFVGVGEVT